ncbi:MAG: hypothetical protein AAF721_02735 [Myxococcota bacterium]
MRAAPRFPSLVLLTLAACAPKPAAHPPVHPTAEVVHHAEKPGPTAAHHPAAAKPDHGVQLHSGQPYTLERRTLTPGRSLIRKNLGYLAWAGLPSGQPRLIVEMSAAGGPYGVRVMDDTGRRIADIDHLWGVHPGAHFARVRAKGGKDGVLDLITGRVVHPKPKLIPGEKAAKTMLVGAAVGDLVWVVTKTKSGRVFAGAWTDRTTKSVPVQTELPFWPVCRDDDEGATLSLERGDSTVEIRPQSGCVGHGMRPVAPGSPLTKDCARVDLGVDGTATCRAVQATEHTNAVFIGDWSIFSEHNAATQMLDPTGTATDPPAPNVFGVWSNKVLFFHGTDLLLWTPNSVTAFTAAGAEALRPGVAGALIAPENPVLPLSDYGAPATAWIDLDAAKIYRFDRPLVAAAEYRAVPQRFFAKEAVGDGTTVHEVDLSSQAVRAVATYDDCAPGELRIRPLHAGQIAVHCETPEEERMPSLLWSEVIDVREGWRAKIDGWIEDDLIGRNRILASEREYVIEHSRVLRVHAVVASP